MKRSNIILIGLTICALLFIAVIPILYSLELHGVVTQTDYSKKAFPNVKVVKVVNAHNVTVMPSDSLIIELKNDDVSIVESGDTLFVSGDAYMIIGLSTQLLVSINSDILFKGALPVLDPPSFSFDIRDTHLYSQSVSRDWKMAQNLGDLRIEDRGNSVIDLNGRFDISHLYLHNAEKFNCSGLVRLFETNIDFDENRIVKTMSCLDGLHVTSVADPGN
jgi:hypothetical protein